MGVFLVGRECVEVDEINNKNRDIVCLGFDEFGIGFSNDKGNIFMRFKYGDFKIENVICNVFRLTLLENKNYRIMFF